MRKVRSVKWILAISAVLSVMLIIAAVVILIKKPSINEMAAGSIKSESFSSMESETHGNITYYYKSEQDFNEGMRFWYDAVVPESHTIAEEYFGDTEAKELNIVVFSDEKAKNDYMHKKYADAYYRYNTIYVDNENIDRYLLLHEYVHYITDAFCKENNISFDALPIWFVEGIAEYASLIPGNLKFAGSTLEEIVDFKEINTNKEYRKLVENGHNVYYQSYLAIYKLIELKGEEVITRILLRSKDMDFYAVFEEEVGIPLEEFQNLLTDI